MEKKTILFVDDEPNILSGLQRMLRPMRKTMNFQFAENGPAALEILANENIDMVISDMRMPGMDGAALLTIVKKQYSHAIRIMLSGQANEDSIMRTVGVVHQFLAKPADPVILKQVIKRALALQDTMANKQLGQLVSSIGSLPSLPKTYVKLQETLKDPDGSLTDVAKIIEQDLAMSVKLLQLVNSAFFGLYNHIESPSHAVNLLGLDTIKALVLVMGVFSELKIPANKFFDVNKLWLHSMATAAFAKNIAAHETDDKEIIDNAFIAGLLHDVGKLLLFSRMPEKYEQAVILANESHCSLEEAERQIFGACHGHVGGYLIGLWGLPGPAVESITYHHHLDSYPEPSFCPPVIIHAADCIYYQLNPENCIGEPQQLNEQLLENLNMLDHVERWVKLCKEIQARGGEDDGCNNN